MTIPKGTWVDLERVVLTPAERAPNLPEDTAATPYVMRVSGFLLADAELGGAAEVSTLIGRRLTGRLRAVNPSHLHSFGETVPELLTLTRGVRP